MICDVSDPAYMSAGTHRVAVVDLNSDSVPYLPILKTGMDLLVCQDGVPLKKQN